MDIFFGETITVIVDVVSDYTEVIFIFIQTILIGLIVSMLLFLSHYYCNVVKLPVLTCTSSEFKSFLKESMPILSEEYWPTIWCYESRIQSIMTYLLCPDFDVPYEREILKLDDGGEVALDWVRAKKAHAPVILILPGLEGSSAEGSVKKFVINAHECDFHCVVFNYRGLSDLELKTPKLSSVNDTADVLQAVQRIRSRFPNLVLGACGVSYGALMLAHYLIQYSHLRDISVAMLNGTPYDIFAANDRIDSGFDVVFNKFLTWKMLRTVARFRHILDTDHKRWDLTKVMKSRTIREYMDTFISKMFGYESVHEYYRAATLTDKMDRIKIPVLCFSSADDMFQPFEYPEENERPLFDNDKVAVVMTAAGGHISHVEGLWPFCKKTSYMHRVFVQYFSAMFQNDSYKQFLLTEET